MRNKSAGNLLKDRIRLSALRLFSECGVENVSVKDIVRGAGTTQPMLYYYFGSRDKLCLSIFENLTHDLLSELDTVLNGKKSLSKKIEELFLVYNDFFASRPGVARFILQGYLSPHAGGSIRKIARQVESGYRQRLRKLLQFHETAGKSPANRNAAILDLLDGIFLHFMLKSRKPTNPENRRSIARQLAGVVCKGVIAGWIALLVSMHIVAPASAQEHVSSGPWTLEDCLARSMESSPSIQAAREGLKVAKGQNMIALAEFVPNFAWNSVYWDNDKAALGTLGANIPGLSPAMTSKDYYISSLSVNQTIFSWRMVPLRRTMKANTKIAALKLAAAENDLTLSIKKAFFTTLYSRQLLAIAAAAESVAKENLETAQALYKEGKVSTFDVSRASVRYVTAKTATISARNTLTVSLEALRMLLSLPAEQDLDIAGDFSETARDVVLDDSINTALARRPELGIAQATENLQAAARELARAGFLPTVFANYTYSWTGKDFAPGSDTDYKAWTAKAGVSIPIFDGMFSAGRLKAQKAGLAQAIAQTRAARDSVVMEVRQQYYSLSNAKESLSAQKENVETAAENLRIAQERYKMGLLSLLDLKDAELSYIDARTQQIKALYDCNTAAASLERAMGRPEANTD